jgi:hypothetical protein
MAGAVDRVPEHGQPRTQANRVLTLALGVFAEKPTLNQEVVTP